MRQNLKAKSSPSALWQNLSCCPLPESLRQSTNKKDDYLGVDGLTAKPAVIAALLAGLRVFLPPELDVYVPDHVLPDVVTDVHLFNVPVRLGNFREYFLEEMVEVLLLHFIGDRHSRLLGGLDLEVGDASCGDLGVELGVVVKISQQHRL